MSQPPPAGSTPPVPKSPILSCRSVSRFADDDNASESSYGLDESGGAGAGAGGGAAHHPSSARSHESHASHASGGGGRAQPSPTGSHATATSGASTLYSAMPNALAAPVVDAVIGKLLRRFRSLPQNGRQKVCR